MNSKVLVAGVVGGVVMFLWGFVSHMLLPLGEAGLTGLPYQDQILPTLSARLKEPGLYMFPWPESPPGTPMPVNTESRKKVEELYKTSPHGLLVFHPAGGATLTGGQLAIEFATNVASSLIAAFLVNVTIGSLGSFIKRVVFVTILGISAGVAVNIPYWNWYGFPSAFIQAEMLGHLVGFALVGIAVAAIVKPPKTAGS